MTTWDIPEEYRELSERKAAEIAGVSRSKFRRRHLEANAPDSISLNSRTDGSKYIPFLEVHRLYGETALLNLKRLQSEPENQPNHIQKSGSEPNDTNPNEPMNQTDLNPSQSTVSVKFNEYISIKTKLASQEVELEQLKKRLDEQKNLLADAKSRELSERARADKLFEELQASRRLLEDKLSSNSVSRSHPLASLWPPNWFK